MTVQAERRKIIERTSLLGILVNLLIASIKIVLGLIASSLAIVSEGINNASDAASSTLTLIGTRLSAKHPDKKHPFGYGRIEYLTSLVISGLILYAGISLLIESIDGIIHPSTPSVSVLMIITVAISAIAKFFLGTYTSKVGKKVDSGALTAIGDDSKNDSFISIITIVVSIVNLIWGFSLDAYAGILFSVIILKCGIETLQGTVSELLGQSGREDLAKSIYHEVRTTPGIINAADMMLHNYGPDTYSGSVNVEIDHACSVGEAYSIIHALQLRIMREYRVTMVFGIYAVDNDHDDVRQLRRHIIDFVKNQPHVLSHHALYIEPETNKIYCDLIVDYDLLDWDSLRADFMKYMDTIAPGREVELTIETDYV